MKWAIRRFVYWLLGIPDEIEESIGGLNWGCQQNAHRINELEAKIERLREMQHRIAGEISYTKEINEKRGHEMPDVMDRWVKALKAGDDL